jgi:hypothetical protein
MRSAHLAVHPGEQGKLPVAVAGLVVVAQRKPAVAAPHGVVAAEHLPEAVAHTVLVLRWWR